MIDFERNLLFLDEMSNTKLPNCNTEYKDPRYWNQRFETEDCYEWLVDYNEIRSSLQKILQSYDESSKFLQLGCGNSNFAIDLYRDGYKDITNIDISEVCVEKMSAKYPQLKFRTMDMTRMEFAENTFDVVIEKASLDSLLVDCKSPWDSSGPGYQSVIESLLEVKKVLKPDGLFVSITFSQPHFRVPLLARPELGWSIEVEKFSGRTGLLDYFLIVCRAGDPGPAVRRWAVSVSLPDPDGSRGENNNDEESDLFLQNVHTSCFHSDSDSESEQ